MPGRVSSGDRAPPQQRSVPPRERVVRDLTVRREHRVPQWRRACLPDRVHLREGGPSWSALRRTTLACWVRWSAPRGQRRSGDTTSLPTPGHPARRGWSWSNRVAAWPVRRTGARPGSIARGGRNSAIPRLSMPADCPRTRSTRRAPGRTTACGGFAPVHRARQASPRAGRASPTSRARPVEGPVRSSSAASLRARAGPREASAARQRPCSHGPGWSAARPAPPRSASPGRC